MPSNIANKQYELSDHLGNVTAVIEDYKTPVNPENLSLGYTATVTTSSNYYPFGMLQPGRNHNANEYRFGFNGKENDNEVKGLGNSLDFGARIYDPRIGRWLSLDPKYSKYVAWSAYHFGFCSPIIVVDNNGEENVIVVGGADVAGGDREKFFNTGLRAFYDMSNNQPKEQTTLVIFTAFMTTYEIADIQNKALDPKMTGSSKVSVLFINTSGELTNYLNSKSLTSQDLSEARKNDQVTDVQIFAHGYANDQGKGPTIEPGHGAQNFVPDGISGVDPQTYHDRFSWGISEIKKLDVGAFDKPIWLFEICNAATTCLSGENKGTNLLKEVSSKTKGVAFGWEGRSDYSSIYPLGVSIHNALYGKIGPSMGYPTAGYINGSNEKSKFVKYENGVKSE